MNFMKLNRIFEEQISLSDRQQYVLAKIKSSATPLLAYEAIVNSEPDVVASKLLSRYGFIMVSTRESKAALSPKGEQAIIEYGIADESGQLTDIGTELVNNYGKEQSPDVDSG